MNNLTERSLVIPCLRFTGTSRISSVIVQFFFNTPVTYFLKYFGAKFRKILTSGSREIGVFPRNPFPHSIAIFQLTTHALHLIGFFR